MMRITLSSSSSLLVRASIASALLACCNVHANPTGASVAAGSATIASQGSRLTVTNSPGAVINWQGFSISAGEVTNFVQQSSSSTVLNRVVGGNASSIAGSLTSNGRVFLVNPNGALFTQSAVVNTAGFTVSTSDISNADFIAGNYGSSGSGSSVSAAQFSGQIQLSSNNIAIGDLAITGSGSNPSIATAGTLNVSGTLSWPSHATLALTTGTSTSSGSSLPGVIATGSGVLSIAGVSSNPIVIAPGSISLLGGTLTTTGGTGGGTVTIAGVSASGFALSLAQAMRENPSLRAVLLNSNSTGPQPVLTASRSAATAQATGENTAGVRTPGPAPMQLVTPRDLPTAAPHASASISLRKREPLY